MALSSTYAAVTITPKFANSKMSIWVSGVCIIVAMLTTEANRKNGATFSNHDNEDLLVLGWDNITGRYGRPKLC